MLSLYTHIPFCISKCFYCSFIIFVNRRNRIDDYLAALEKEINLQNEKNLSRTIGSLYFGGGTPSILSARQLDKMFYIYKKMFKIPDSAEQTVELNPELVTLDQCEVFKSNNINRISLGVQSFNARYLRMLGRNHINKDVDKTVDMLRSTGINNINFDLIFGLPGQTLSQVKKDILRIKEYDCEHVSLYCLEVEKGSKFYISDIKKQSLENQEKQYRFIIDELSRFGYAQYEVSNFAKRSKESVHNINYWECGDYLGFGVAAHSHLDGRRYANTNSFNDYIKNVNDELLPVVDDQQLSDEERLIESVLFGLRMNKGVNLNYLQKKFKTQLSEDKLQLVDDFVEMRFLERQGSYLVTTMEGKLILDDLSARLI